MPITPLANDRTKKLGRDLYRFRIKANKTQAEIASHLGYSSSQYVSNVERGLHTVCAKNVVKMLGFYEVHELEKKRAVKRISQYLSDRYYATAFGKELK